MKKYTCPLCYQKTAYQAEFNKKIIVCKCEGLNEVGKIIDNQFIPNQRNNWNIRKLNSTDSIMEYGLKFNNAAQNFQHADFFLKNGESFVVYKNNNAKYMLLTKNQEIMYPKKSFLSGYNAEEVDSNDIEDLFNFLINQKIVSKKEKLEYINSKSIKGNL